MEKLNNKKLRIELAKIDKNYAWLARKIGYTRQYINIILQTRSLKHIDKIAAALKVDPKKLITKR